MRDSLDLALPQKFPYVFDQLYLWLLTSFSFEFWILILGEGEGFDFWVPEKREELRDLVLVFRTELGFVLGRKSFFFF